MTYAGDIVNSGMKSNSMYESNTVRGCATNSDMLHFYAKESYIKKCIDREPNGMTVQKFDKVDLNSISPVRVESVED